MFGQPYGSPFWPKGADRDAYRAKMRRGYPNASEAQIDQLGAALAMIDANTKNFISDSQVEAEELALQFGFQREPHTGLIHCGEDRKAA